MAKNNVKIVAIAAIIIELILVAAAVDTSNNNNRLTIPKECVIACSAKCFFRQGIWKVVCIAGCLLECAGSSVAKDGPATQCAQSCAVSMCSHFLNPDDDDKLEACIADNCIQKCLPSH